MAALLLGWVTPTCHPSGSSWMEGMMSFRIGLELSMTCPNSWGGEYGFLLEVREVQVLKEWGNAGGWQQSTENPSPFWLLGLRVYMTFGFNLLELIVSTI